MKVSGFGQRVTLIRVIDDESWGLCSDPSSMAIDSLTLAVDVAPDRSVAAVSLAGCVLTVCGMLSLMSIGRALIGWPVGLSARAAT